MKAIIRSVLLMILSISLLPINTVAAAEENQIFMGIVTVNGASAPDGTIITGTLNGQDNYTYTSGGNYQLLIQAREGDQAGDLIYFYINGTSVTTSSFSPDAATLLNLSATLSEYTLTISTIGRGSVAGEGSYLAGAMVAITATADEGWVFDGWTGDTGTFSNTSSANTYITMNGDYSITANFVEAEIYDLTIMIEGSGFTDPPAGVYSYFEEEVVYITAVPDIGWKFDGWTGGVMYPDSTVTAVIMDSDKTITANFLEVGTYKLTISSNGQGVTNPSAGAHEYTKDAAVIITAIPMSGWLFDSWTGDVANPKSATTTVTMNSDKAIAANFVLKSANNYNLTININGNGSVTGAGTYEAGTVVNVSAIPADGWKFDSWTGDVADPDSANTTVTMDSNKTITANFIAGEPEKYTLAINVSGEGSTDPAAGVYSYAPGAVVDISAIPVDGWVFDSWTGYVANPDSADTTIIMNADKNITAVFSDVTPPEVSTVSSSDVGKTEANISWSTDEPGSSQVEYWASSSQFTKADLRMVTDHFVHLTGLTPATKYSCRVISVDENGNETISGTYTFTTSGSPAAFTTDDWDMQLSDVEGGKKAIVSFTITNAGDTSGRYSEILKVNGEAEDIKNGILAGGDSEEIKFTVIKTVIGTYEISVDEFSSSFTVPVSGLPIWIKVTGIILGTLILNALIPFLIIRYKNARKSQ